MRALLPLSLFATLTLWAGPVAAQDFYQDIRPILAENCVGCHTAEGVAWSMDDAESTYERRRLIARLVTDRRMPPWLAEPGHQDYVGDLSLGDDELALVSRWVEAGYPKGTPRPDPEMAARSMHSSFQPDISLDVLPADGYLPNQESSDDYRCFLVDWTGDETAFVTGFRASPGNRNVAHHVVVHAVQPGMMDRFRELDEEEAGPGYQCFGGALPDRLGQRDVRAAYEERYPNGLRDMSNASHWLAHWAPGMDGHVFPEGTGIRLDPGSGLVVQMHYYSSTAPGESDIDTSLDFMVESTVERPAFHLAQTRNDWLVSERSGTMVIPPESQRTFEVANNLGDMLGYFAFLAQVPEDQIQALELHSANLHMHSFGHSGEITLSRDTGEVETLLSVPRWDLAWQRDFSFREPKILSRESLDDTRLAVRCTFENPTAETVYGGYGSAEEMCFNFSYIAVRAAPSTDGPVSGGR
jgi:hypothetical protein